MLLRETTIEIKMASFFIALTMLTALYISPGLAEQEPNIFAYEIDEDLDIEFLLYKKRPDEAKNQLKTLFGGYYSTESFYSNMDSFYHMSREKSEEFYEHPERFGLYDLIASAAKKGNGYKGYFEACLLNHNDQVWVDPGMTFAFDMYPDVEKQRIECDIIIYVYGKTDEEIGELIKSLVIEFRFEVDEEIFNSAPRKRVRAHLESIRPYSEKEDTIRWIPGPFLENEEDAIEMGFEDLWYRYRGQ